MLKDFETNFYLLNKETHMPHKDKDNLKSLTKCFNVSIGFLRIKSKIKSRTKLGCNSKIKKQI
jgi:hypothetical protein